MPHHHHVTPVNFQNQAAAASPFVAAVGKVNQQGQQISGRSGEHYKIYLDTGKDGSHEVDINVQSEDGSDVLVFIGPEDGVEQPDSDANGDPAYGVYNDAQLSYSRMGFTDDAFAPLSDVRAESLLQNDLKQAAFLAIYGTTYNDGGPAGIHLIHYNERTPGQAQDGAIAFYIPTDTPKVYTRKWYFFKFNNQTIGQP